MKNATTNHFLALGTLALSLGAPAFASAQWAMTQPSPIQPPPVQAEGEDARALFMRGEAAYAQGGYEEAATLWERAYALDARAGLQFNLSQAYERLGRLEEAATALQRYVDGTTPDDARLADARARLAAIRERISHTAIRLEGGPEGAVLLIDGEDQGRLPRRDPLPVSSGNHEVRVQASGYRDFVASVAVTSGQAAEVRVVMEAAGSSTPIGPIVTLATGGVLVITGLALGGVALDQAGRATSRTDSNAESVRTMALVSDVLWGAGAAVAAAGVIWLIVDLGSSGSAEQATAFQLVPYASPEGAGAVATLRF
jgi:hypothetical protein